MTTNEALESSTVERPRIVKVWGTEEVIVNTPQYCGKILRFAEGHAGSLHYHCAKDECFLAVEGLVEVEIIPPGGAPPYFTMLSGWRGDALRLPPRTVHRVTPLDGPAVLIEFSTSHSDGDVERLEPSR